ncbi:MAG: histidine--tRNA ligase [Proteobacteria bacterium]|nr:MAG: histidine--tRNA ligase [Pseudomonadota bacterium]
MMRGRYEIFVRTGALPAVSKTDKIEPRKLKGFRDLLPQQARLKKEITDVIWKNAVLAGFDSIETPALEYADTLLGTGEETDKEVYRFLDHGERSVALRFDMTVPFARYVVENFSELTFPFKKLQIGNSWRGEKPQKGRYREFCQADLDIIGVDSLSADVEVISCIVQNLNELLPKPFTMSLGHRIILSALIRKSIPEIGPNEFKVLIAIDKLAKIGKAAVLKIISELSGVKAGEADDLLNKLLRKNSEGDSDLDALKELFTGDLETVYEITRLQSSAAIIRQLVGHTGHGQVRVDLSIARGLGYYTGIVFETTIDGLDGFGSISSGGRYNGLVNRFSSQELPGIGGSIGVDRLLAAMEQLQTTSEVVRNGVFIALGGADCREYGFELLQKLRQQKIVSDIALKEGKLGNQFKYADKRRFAFVLTIGGDELAAKTMSLKNLATGEEHRSISQVEGFQLLSR